MGNPAYVAFVPLGFAFLCPALVTTLHLTQKMMCSSFYYKPLKIPSPLREKARMRVEVSKIILDPLRAEIPFIASVEAAPANDGRLDLGVRGQVVFRILARTLLGLELRVAACIDV